jgi:hypothetical protein
VSSIGGIQMDHMYIRHAIGGTLFLDSVKHNCSYEIQTVNDIWKFVIEVSDDNAAEEVVKNRNELNIFVLAQDNPDHKTWYYTTHGEVDYDKANHKLTILADVRMDYSV